MPDLLVSICIPAYENPVFIKRLLDSVLLQSYSRTEIIVSDDSAGEDIKNALSVYNDILDIRYFKNIPPLKTPANWNQALDKAGGDLLMLMHQDDWFANAGAIKKYVEAFERNPDADFVFCRSRAFDEKIHSKKIISGHREILSGLQKHPEKLLLGNVIGPPSNLMFRKKIATRYNEPYIWLVDVEYYIRLLNAGHRFFFLDEPLVAVGLHDQQTTVFVQQNKKIILKEYLLLSSGLGANCFSNWRIYDLYWRLLRNYKVRDNENLSAISIVYENLPPVIKQLMSFQRKIPSTILQIGLFSKILMWLAFLNRPRS
jgi:glycosyltransferase involved in cell wall biosynthesis